MTVDDARTHYRTVQTVLTAERAKRAQFLGEPRRSQALAEIDDALAALRSLGEVIADAANAGLLTALPQQAPLLDTPDTKRSTPYA